MTTVRPDGAGFALPPEMLGNAVAELEANSISAGEFEQTERDWRFFCEWTRAHGREYLPATPTTLALFLFSQRDHWGWSASRSVARSVGRAHEWAGVPSPCDDELVRRLLSAVARHRGRRQEKRTAPIRAQDAVAILAQAPQREGLLGGAAVLERRDRAALLLSRAAKVPLRQLVRVCRTDVKVGDDAVELDLPACPPGYGWPALPARRLRLARLNGVLCPVAAVERLLAALPDDATLLLGVGYETVDRQRLGPIDARAAAVAITSSLRTAARRANLVEAWASTRQAAPPVRLHGRTVLLVGCDERQEQELTQLITAAGGLASADRGRQASHMHHLDRANYTFAVVAPAGRRRALTRRLSARGVETVGIRDGRARLTQPDDYLGAGLPEQSVEGLSLFCNTDLLRQMRDRVYLLLGVALCRRHAELRMLVIGHLKRVEGGFEVTVPPTKRRGESSKPLDVLFLERTDGPACPVTALEKWLGMLEVFGHVGDDLPLLPAIRSGRPNGRLPESTGRMSAYMRRLVDTVDTIVSESFMLPGQAPRISTRSLRVGGIVTFSESGADAEEIAETSLHESLEQLAVYLRVEDPFTHAHHLNV
jgi:hypothetical protein